MGNIFKAKEIYKKTPVSENPNKPLVKLHGLYVAGTYRPPYFIDCTLTLSQISSTPAEVVYYTEASDTGYDDNGDGLLHINGVTIGDPTIISFTQTSDTGYDDNGNGLLRINGVTIGELDVYSFTNVDDSGYDDNGNGLLRINDVTLTGFTVTEISYLKNTQPPGQPVLNIKSIATVVATVT